MKIKDIKFISETKALFIIENKYGDEIEQKIWDTTPESFKKEFIEYINHIFEEK